MSRPEMPGPPPIGIKCDERNGTLSVLRVSWRNTVTWLWWRRPRPQFVDPPTGPVQPTTAAPQFPDRLYRDRQKSKRQPSLSELSLLLTLWAHFLLPPAFTSAQNPITDKAPTTKCPGCVGPADPDVILHGSTPGRQADVTVKPSEGRRSLGGFQNPKRKSSAARSKSLGSAREPETWFNLLFGGEYWYGWKGGEWWNASGEVTLKLLDTLRQVRPQVLHASIFGPELLTGIHTGGQLVGFTPISPKGISTVREYLDWWRKFNAAAHREGIKVQATFNMTLIWDNQARNKGWFKYFNDFWEEQLLGPKPVGNPMDLLQRDGLGQPLSAPDTRWQPDFYSYKGCPNNPHWRQLLKQMIKAGIEAGFDGYMVQVLFRDDCLCQYCQQGFRDFLAARYSADVLRDQFGIDDVAEALLDTTRGRGPAWVPTLKEADDRLGALAMAARQFTDESMKRAFDEVFVDYGRSLKPDLLLSAWTHQRGFLVPGADYRSFERITDERSLLSPQLWGKRENYLWYCIGKTSSRLSEHITGDASLSAKFIYSMGRGKPFVVMKYDYERPRLNISEAWAHRGIGLALNQEEFQEILAPYYSFVQRYRNLYYPSESHAELALLLPRRGFYLNDTSFLATFDRFGRALLETHHLFDVVVDQRLSEVDLRRYRALLIPTTRHLSPAERRQLQAYREAGGTLLVAGKPGQQEMKENDMPERLALIPDNIDATAIGNSIDRALSGSLSHCDAPWTVQMTAWHQPQAHRLIIHLVNYDRDENALGQENPRAARPMMVHLNLPAGATVSGIRFITPEEPEPKPLKGNMVAGQIHFQTPGFLVYGVAVLDYAL